MDYQRIYAAFIQDRRQREPHVAGYTERHHIIPRCLGGGNARGNLIRLTPEDHYFVHLLLAKAHGGKLISALSRMLQSTERTWGRRLAARRSFGFAQRMVSAYMREKWLAQGNPLFNATVFHWWNYRTKETEASTIFDMHMQYGAGRPIWTQVANGDRPSIRGWMLEANKETHKRSEKGQIFNFVNRDGRAFVGTQGGFATAHGLNLASCSRMVRGGSVTECGWRLVGTLDRVANGPKNGRRSSRQGTGKIFRLRHRDGRLFAGTADDFRILHGKPEGFSMSVRLSQLVTGAAPSVYGWYLIDVAKQEKLTTPMVSSPTASAHGSPSPQTTVHRSVSRPR